jgi:hypothetical protein
MLVLLGPFVDERNKVVERGYMSLDKHVLTYEQLFELLLTTIAEAVQVTHNLLTPQDIQTKVLIIPSVRDVHHPYPFPQPCFNLQGSIQTGANPQRLMVNDISITLLNADVFSDIESTTVSNLKGAALHDGVVQSLLEHRSLYPVFPPPTSDFPVEYKYEQKFLLETAPDILITPSTHACFVHVPPSLSPISRTISANSLPLIRECCRGRARLGRIAC